MVCEVLVLEHVSQLDSVHNLEGYVHYRLQWSGHDPIRDVLISASLPLLDPRLCKQVCLSPLKGTLARHIMLKIQVIMLCSYALKS